MNWSSAVISQTAAIQPIKGVSIIASIIQVRAIPLAIHSTDRRCADITSPELIITSVGTTRKIRRETAILINKFSIFYKFSFPESDEIHQELYRGGYAVKRTLLYFMGGQAAISLEPSFCGEA